MLDNGADPDAAVREAGGALARDRSSDEQRARGRSRRWATRSAGLAAWSCASSSRATSPGCPYGATAPAAPQPPPAQPPYQPPCRARRTRLRRRARRPASVQSPADASPSPAYAAAPPRKSRTGLYVGLLTTGVAVIAAASCWRWSPPGTTHDTAARRDGEAATLRPATRAWRARATSTSCPTAGRTSPTRSSMTTPPRPPSTRRAPGRLGRGRPRQRDHRGLLVDLRRPRRRFVAC